jgi:tRNA (adenine37-N6)-methyltransferase
MNEQQMYQVHPIGYVRHSPEGFALEILLPYRPALKHLDQFSHVHVLWWADRHDNAGDRSTMQAGLPYAPGVTAGVFACRAEYRPNPIAVTTCLMLDVDVDKGIVIVPWIDAFDGTPVLDLKPYIPVSDRVRDFEVAEWFAEWPDWTEDGAKFFAESDIDVD